MVEMVTVLNWSNTTSTEKTDTFYLRAYQKFVIHVTNVYTGSGSPHIKVLEPDGLTLVDVPISTPMDFSEIVSNKQGTFTFKSILCSGFIQAEANRPNPSSSFYAPTSSTLQAGQSYTIKWYAATDDDGDVDFYRISYSLNGSTTWNPIEQTANTQITFTIPSGTTIQFSVQAWDKTQLSSGYTYSQIYTVETNQPPTTPSQFYNPASATTLQAGSTIALSWASSTDPDGNMSGYYIYKSLNGGSYSYLATATSTQYSTTIPTGGYSTVQFRVVAYDSKGASSGNRDSAVITINNNNTPTIVVKDSSNNVINNNQIIPLTNENDYIFNFTPNDADTADTLQYSVSLGSVVLTAYTPCTKNLPVSYTITFADLVRGNNVITLKVKDNKNAERVFVFTLRNKVTDALSYRTVLQILQSLGYTNTQYRCLNDLKPTGYSKTVLSMSDIISSI